MNALQELRLPKEEQIRRVHFEKLDDGRLCYSPYGVQSIFVRSRYVVPEDMVPRIIRIHRILGRALTVGTGVILLGAAIVLLRDADGVIRWAEGVPWLPVLALMIIAMIPVWGPALAIPRLVGPLPKGPSRTFAELASIQERKMGSTKEMWLTFAGFIAFVVVALVLVSAVDWFRPDMIQSGYTGIGLSLIVGIGGMVPVLLLFPAAFKVRRLRAENERLEAVVRTRTAELQELNRTLEARVQDQVRDIERLGQLKHFFSAPVAEMILEGKGFDPAKVHRRELTAVSVDLRGFTAFSETSEPEEVISVLRVYHAELGILVNRC
jgi:hypothetical protein